MAAIVLLRDKETGLEHSKYTADARESVAANPDKWEFVRRLGTSAVMRQPGVAEEGSDHVQVVGEPIPGLSSQATSSEKDSRLADEDRLAAMAQREADVAAREAAANAAERGASKPDLAVVGDSGAAAGVGEDPKVEIEAPGPKDPKAKQGKRGGGPQEPATASPDAVDSAQQ